MHGMYKIKVRFRQPSIIEGEGHDRTMTHVPDIEDEYVACTHPAIGDVLMWKGKFHVVLTVAHVVTVQYNGANAYTGFSHVEIVLGR